MNFKYPLILRRTNNCRLIINIHRSKKAIIVSAPHFLTTAQINSFIAEKEMWIHKKIDLIEESCNRIKLDNDEIFLLGNRFKLISAENEKNVTTNFEKKTVTGNVDVLKNKASLKIYYRNLSKRYIIPYAFQLSKRHNIEIKRIFIRDQKTSWGTCSSKNNLSFNLRLMLCPEPVIKYIIYHELSHTIHMNHSGKFWKQVESFYPEYWKQKQWLKEYSFAIREIV